MGLQIFTDHLQQIPKSSTDTIALSELVEGSVQAYPRTTRISGDGGRTPDRLRLVPKTLRLRLDRRVAVSLPKPEEAPVTRITFGPVMGKLVGAAEANLLFGPRDRDDDWIGFESCRPFQTKLRIVLLKQA